METKEIRVESINAAYDIYKGLITDKNSCQSNQKLLSVLAIQIDAFSLASILNFFNKYSDLSKENWQSNLLIIRMFALFVTELFGFLRANKYFDASLISDQNSLENVKLLRNKIHQFRNQDFKQKIQHIDQNMGRSRDKFAPRIDICLQYTGSKELMGTNIYWFNFSEAKDQVTVDLMQQIIRSVEKISKYPNTNFEINRSKKSVTYQYEPYCYVDIVKSCKLKNKKLIDRLLLAFDDMCSIYDFFVYVVDVDKYLEQAPYISFYFIKILAVILDETIDNFKNVLQYNRNEYDTQMITELLNICPSNIQEFCKTLRNNIHYERQEDLLLYDELPLFEELFTICKKLVANIRKILNIKPSKAKLCYYNFLKWIQE